MLVDSCSCILVFLLHKAEFMTIVISVCLIGNLDLSGLKCVSTVKH